MQNILILIIQLRLIWALKLIALPELPSSFPRLIYWIIEIFFTFLKLYYSIIYW